MATSYPGSLDNFTNPTSTSPINSPSHADQHSNANDAIEAIESELGTNPKGAKATVKARLDDVDTAIALKAPIASPTFTGTVTIPAGSAITGVPYLATANTFTGNNTFASPIVAFVGTSGSYSSAAVSGYNIIHLSQGMILINSQTGGDYNLATNAYYNSGWKYFESAGSTLINFGNGRFDFNTASSGTAGNAITYTSKMTIANSGTVTINGFGAGSQGLIVKGAASQTANLQEWQNSAGTPIATMSPGGNLDIALRLTAYNGISAYNASTFGDPTNLSPYAYSNMVGISTGSASNVGLVIRGVTSQTGDLQQWRNSSGSVLAAIKPSGQLKIQNIIDLSDGGPTIQFGSAAMNIWTFNSTSIPLIINAFTGQTADLQQWKDSSGNIAVRVNATGNIVSPNIAYFGTSSLLNATLNVQSVATNWAGIAVKGIASQTGDLQSWYTSGGNKSVWVDANGQLGTGYFFTNFGGGQINLGLVTISGIGDIKPLVIRGVSGQTQYLQEWQNSSGSSLAYMSRDGHLVAQRVYAPDSLYVVANGGPATVNIETYSAATVGVIIKGKASQSADLQQWQTSAGTVQASFDNNGRYNLNATYGSGFYGRLNVAGTSSDGYSFDLQTINGNTPGVAQRINLGNPSDVGLIIVGYGSGVATGDLLRINGTYGLGGGVYFRVNANGEVQAYNSTSPGLIVKGVASQSADLQQWKNNSGTILAKIDSNGSFTATDLTLSGNLTVNGTTTNLNSTNLVIEDKNIIIADVATPTDTTADGAGITIKGTADKTFNWVQSTKSFTSSEPLIINNSSTDAATLTVKMNSSQTSNIQEWRDQNGNIVAKIGPMYGSNVASFDPFSYGAGAGYSQILIGGRGITNEQRAAQSKFGVTTGEWVLGALRATDNQVGAFAVSTTLPTFTVKAVASQTADLQQWQDSAGTIKASVRSSGGLSLNYANSIRLYNTANTDYAQLWMDNGSGGSNLYVKTNYPVLMGNVGVDTGASLTVATQSTGQVGQVIRGAASQTANLQEWQDSTGTSLVKISSSGVLITAAGQGVMSQYYTGLSSGAGAYIEMGSNSMALATRYATNTIRVVGAASQTANLQEWQNSAGTVLSAVNALGQGVFTNTTPITASAVSQAITAVSFTSTTATYTFSATAQTISVGEYVTIFGITPSGYNGTYQVTAVATVSAGTSYSFTVANNTNATVTVGTGYFFPSASVSILTQNKAHTGLIIKAVSGQTASTMEIQNSLGQPVTWWDSTGGMTASQAVVSTLYSGGFMNTGTLGYFNATTFNASTIPIVVRGAASQTADLQQWQNSSGTTLLSITPNGSIKGGNSNTISVNTATTVDTVALSSFTSMEYTLSIKQGSKIRSSKVLVHTDGTSVDSTEYGIMEMGGGITGILVTASVSSTNAILQVTITDAATTNATVKLIKTML